MHYSLYEIKYKTIFFTIYNIILGVRVISLGDKLNELHFKM
jgi:hypothetical protein